MNAIPPDPKRNTYNFIIEPWSFRMKGSILLWVVPGHTQVYGTLN